MTVNPIPEGYTTVTPWLISSDTDGLITWMEAAFDAVELGRMADEEGRIAHAEARIGNAVVMMFDARPEWPPTPGFLRLYVPDADTAHRRAVEAGGTSVTEVTHLFFGDRVGRVRDPWGNLWWIQTRVEDVSPEEAERRLTDPGFVKAMEYVQSADFFPGR
ncbi:VOC family protein [Nonomuraea sp. WAC 01424]|uniref:VOC family protein n=1 Tax=Nonomuraea sp. WAC 01424 TaxID=2203200 RepID=UPI000F7AE49E|nr:VOC family protein [Nonomuraea sp. WAC 01424]RSN08431.1 VOC family protein [Nonomuraea sp. WAC 01424]